MKIIRKQWGRLSQGFLEFSGKVNWTVFGLIVVFAPSSWLNVNGNYLPADDMPNYGIETIFSVYKQRCFIGDS